MRHAKVGIVHALFNLGDKVVSAVTDMQSNAIPQLFDATACGAVITTKELSVSL
jgi:hypothetical protein